MIRHNTLQFDNIDQKETIKTIFRDIGVSTYLRRIVDFNSVSFENICNMVSFVELFINFFFFFDAIKGRSKVILYYKYLH